MRRGRAIAVGILLLLAASSLPLAEAQKEKPDKKRGPLEGLVRIEPPPRRASAHEGPDEHAEEARKEEDAPKKAPRRDASESSDKGGGDLARIAGGGQTTGVLAVAGIVAVLLLGLALAGTWWARRPTKERPRKRTFEDGRAKGHAKRPATVREALDAFAAGRSGSLVRSQALPDAYDVTVSRKKANACHQTAGYLAGLFESVWADAVRVEHPSCAGEAGGECRYIVKRGAAAAVNGSARPMEAASTRR